MAETRETPNFVISYELRDAQQGLGHGTRGVRSTSIIDWYCEGLEASARCFSNLGWAWPTTTKTPVYVASLDERFPMVGESIPFTSVYNDEPFIGLPCRISEPTIQGARSKAMADAAHEAVHVLNATYRPFLDARSAPWRWFNEGTAVFGERYVLDGNPDSLRFAMDWCDRPDDPLDSDRAVYQAGFFVHYLVNRFGTEFLAKVWKEARENESPIDTMDRLLQLSSLRFADPDPTIPDVFGDGYAIDSYCDWGKPAASFAGDAFQRYSPRAVNESFEISSGDSVKCRNDPDVLDHLATSYYRFFLGSGVKRLKVSLTSRTDEFLRLKARLVTVSSEWTRSACERLKPVADGGGSRRLDAVLAIERPETIDHVVLVVANCGVRSACDGVAESHDDTQEFTVEAASF